MKIEKRNARRVGHPSPPGNRPADRVFRYLALIAWLLISATGLAIADGEPTLGPLPDPSARLLRGDGASEYWTLYIELDGGRRITQRFLLTNAGPGEHTAVAVGHLIEPGRAPYRYENGRRRSRWTLSDDRLFFDIAASHLDLHRPRGRLLITKDDIEIRLDFDFAKSDLALSVPRKRLPPGYAVDVLAVGARTSGTLQAPWMATRIETSGRLWMAHTWTERAEAEVLDRRIDVYGADGPTVFYALDLRKQGLDVGHFMLARDATGRIIESPIEASETWIEASRPSDSRGSNSYPLPGDLSLTGPRPGRITLSPAWLRFDPLAVIPNPFRWFIRRVTQPQEVWADAEIDVTLWSASGSPPLPQPGASGSETESRSSGSKTRSSFEGNLEESLNPNQGPSRRTIGLERETEKGSAVRSVTGVASITFTNPTDRR